MRFVARVVLLKTPTTKSFSHKYIMKFNLKELIVTALVYLTIDITYIKMNVSMFKKYFAFIRDRPQNLNKTGQ